MVEPPFSYKTDAIYHYWQEVGGGGIERRGRYPILQFVDGKKEKCNAHIKLSGRTNQFTFRCLLCGSDKPLLRHMHFRMHMQVYNINRSSFKEILYKFPT